MKILRWMMGLALSNTMKYGKMRDIRRRTCMVSAFRKNTIGLERLYSETKEAGINQESMEKTGEGRKMKSKAVD